MLDKVPLIRIALPFVAGILLANAYSINIYTVITSITTAVVIMTAIRICLRNKPASYLRIIPILSALTMAIAAFAGWYAGSSAIAIPANISQLNGNTVIARVDNINNRNFSTSVEATILSCPGRNKTLTHKTPVAITITANDYNLLEGDIITFKAGLSPIESLGNPNEFDFATFMRRKGILYNQLLAPGEYSKIGTGHNIFTISRTLQRNVINHIINSGMHPDTQRFLCTILLGDSSFLEPDTRQYYSQAGISHILALSGLHMGIIVGIMFMLLKPLCYFRLRRLRIAIVIPCILAYLFVTGTMPSATRSAIMVIFILIADLMHRRNSSLNALMASALIILAVSPNSIYDVGFQLSFAAVLSILLFYKKFLCVSPRKRFLHYWVSSLTLTSIATLGTVMISAYYFHVIPLLSVVSNIIVLPFLPAYLCVALLHTVLLCAGVEIGLLSTLLDISTAAIDYVAIFISKLPCSSLSYIDISPFALLIFFTAFATFSLWVYRKKFIYAIVTLSLILSASILNLFEYMMLPQSGMVIQNNYTSTPILFFNGNDCKVWCADDSIDIDEFCRNNIGFISRYRLEPVEAATLPYTSTGCFIKPPFAFIEGKRIAVAANTALRHLHANYPIKIDYLVITTSYYGHITDLLDTFEPEMIVLSGGIYDDTEARFIQEADTLAIPVHNLHTDGAIFLKNGTTN